MIHGQLSSDVGWLCCTLHLFWCCANTTSNFKGGIPWRHTNHVELLHPILRSQRLLKAIRPKNIPRILLALSLGLPKALTYKHFVSVHQSNASGVLRLNLLDFQHITSLPVLWLTNMSETNSANESSTTLINSTIYFWPFRLTFRAGNWKNLISFPSRPLLPWRSYIVHETAFTPTKQKFYWTNYWFLVLLITQTKVTRHHA